jgi:hypothetical protein
VFYACCDPCQAAVSLRRDDYIGEARAVVKPRRSPSVRVDTLLFDSNQAVDKVIGLRFAKIIMTKTRRTFASLETDLATVIP